VNQLLKRLVREICRRASVRAAHREVRGYSTLGDRTEKKIVQELAVHGYQGIEFRGDSENHMEILNGQEVFTARLDPSLFP
jgi:hypothetical protein